MLVTDFSGELRTCTEFLPEAEADFKQAIASFVNLEGRAIGMPVNTYL